MSTTFIIGAGASKAVWGFPVLKGFLQDCQGQLARIRDGQGESYLERYIASRFGPLAEVNLEDVLTDLDSTLFGLGGMWYGTGQASPRTTALFIRGQLLRIIQERLAINPEATVENGVRLADYGNILRGTREEDAIVTLNYDCGIEAYVDSLEGSETDALTRQRVRDRAGELLGDLFDQTETPLVDDERLVHVVPGLLKLHGSTDYFACANASCPTRYRIFLAEYRGSPSDSICPTCGSFLEAVIVPPTASKSFERFPKLALLWRLAERSLARCDRIVVWGFSCPAIDHHFAWLLRNCCRARAAATGSERLLHRVEVIDPDHENVIARLKGLIDPAGAVEWRGSVDDQSYRGA